ncbi:hypothetical protein FRB95_002971 [Tulasnella sp. JGI-2019a]|nr:hypothetical protein FRB93_007620 [Tulasnella sp. JGI-2019a]KAG9038043.1 hypothetical protein FRB95_002971 [Tulasnella sp. JGI-2019a]
MAPSTSTSTSTIPSYISHTPTTGSTVMSSTRRLHRRQEGPERGLACVACRSKKQKCDRRRPSCSSCVAAYENCFYANRKQKATVVELEEILRKREQEYAQLIGTDPGSSFSHRSTPQARISLFT